MKSLQWKDEYVVGIAAVDFQHRQIFDCIMGILGRPTDNDRFRAETEAIKLLSLVQQHFSLEEGMMRNLCYPDAELNRHIEEHRHFTADMYDLAQRSLRTKGGVSLYAIWMAHSWLTEHMMTMDKDYAAFFSNPAHKSGNLRQWANQSIAHT